MGGVFGLVRRIQEIAAQPQHPSMVRFVDFFKILVGGLLGVHRHHHGLYYELVARLLQNRLPLDPAGLQGLAFGRLCYTRAPEVFMKRSVSIVTTLFLATLLGCAPETPTASTAASQQQSSVAEPAATATDAPDAVSEELSMHYMEAAAALGMDNFDGAKMALTALANESKGDLQTLAQAAADTGQIAAMREKFKPLSEVASKMNLPDGYAVALCPMYKGGSKWVQKRDTLSNPYFGAAMSTCGSFIN